MTVAGYTPVKMPPPPPSGYWPTTKTKPIPTASGDFEVELRYNTREGYGGGGGFAHYVYVTAPDGTLCKGAGCSSHIREYGLAHTKLGAKWMARKMIKRYKREQKNAPSQSICYTVKGGK